MGRETIADFDPQVETEPFPHYPILLTGTGSGLGNAYARKFALEGYEVFAGTRSKEKFENLRNSIAGDGGIEPQPFIADITKPDQLIAAYQDLHLPPGGKVHFMPVAAGGLEVVRMGIARQIVSLKRAMKTDAGLTPKLLEQATDVIRKLTSSDEATTAAMDINYAANQLLFDLLYDNGHIGADSVIVTTSSSLSSACDPDHPENYNGNRFYFSIAISKERGVRELKNRAARIGCTLVDIVAPIIADTDVGAFIEGIIDVVDRTLIIHTPKVTTTQVVNATFSELTKNDPNLPRIRTVYVQDSGISYKRPEEWDKPLIPYL